MATRSLRGCRICGRATHGAYCAEHRTKDRDRQRDRREGVGRLYGTAAWRRTSAAVLSRDRWCKIKTLCGGRAPATDADHIIPADQYVGMHGGDWSFFFDLENLQGACHEDHSHKTAIERHRGGARG
ncbi:MAG TPA: HNH endonuclease signature motif containing protein [Candidatus Binatia bacterium]|jgi:5-methylcytosine-specific restriction endonuclease McrA|nr:HNH endonuclease signature motif containing protein [Candidatus Binatia bacterium]